MTFQIAVNGINRSVDDDDDTPLLEVLSRPTLNSWNVRSWRNLTVQGTAELGSIPGLSQSRRVPT